MLPTIPQPYDVANCLTRRMHKGINSTLDEGQTPIIAPQTSSVCPPLTTRPYGDNESQQNKLVLSQYGEIAGALTRRHDSSPCPDRGMTVIAIHPHCIGRSPSSGPQGKEYLRDGSAYTMDTKGTQAIAIRTAQTSSNGNGISEELAHTLDSANCQAVAFAQNQIGEIRTGKVCGTINRNSNASGRNAPSCSHRTRLKTVPQYRNGRGHPPVLASAALPHGNVNDFRASPTITQRSLGGAVPQKNALTGLGTRRWATVLRFQ